MPAVNARRADFYHDPHVYDVLHHADTAFEARVLTRLARAHARPRGPLRWLEPACGTARLLIHLARRGHHAAGFDLSPRMIRYARARAATLLPDAPARPTLWVADLRAPRPRSPAARAAIAALPADVAFCTNNTLRHLPRDADLVAHLRAVRPLLAPGGVYLVGLEVTRPGWAQPTEDVWTSTRDGLRVRQIVQYLPPPRTGRVETVLSHLVVTAVPRSAARAPAHIDSRYALRTYTLAQWRAVLRAAGWRILATYDAEGNPAVAPIMGYRLWVIAPSPPRPCTPKA